MPQAKRILGLPGFEILKVEGSSKIDISVRYTGPTISPKRGGTHLRTKGLFTRKIRYKNIAVRKYRCLDCGRHLNQRFGYFPGGAARRLSGARFLETIIMVSVEKLWLNVRRSEQPP